MVITRTPLRISFVGGETDYREYYKEGYGAVVSTTINKYVYVIVKPWFSKDIRVSYSEGQIVDRVEDVKHANVREALKMTGVTGGVEIAYLADVPIGSLGTGLGASSALTVGLLHALHALKGAPVSPKRLAEEACKIEREILDQPGGKQDQYAVAYGGFNYIRFHKDESVSVRPIPLEKKMRKNLEEQLMLFYTGIATESHAISAEKKKRVSENRSVLDRMLEITEKKHRMLRRNQIKDFGKLLHENWLCKRSLASNVTKPVIDEYYEKAIRAGAEGGKILGSGGGGFLLFYCEGKKQDDVRKALSDLRELSFSFNKEGSTIVRLNK